MIVRNVPLLKSLGFLSSDGAPTARYHAYRDQSQARRVMAEALREAYPAGGYKMIIENWRQLPDGQIEFTMRHLPAADR